MSESLKLVLVGDGTVGKTCLLSVYTSGTFPREYVPTVVENTSLDISVDNHSVRLNLWDTAGQEDYDRLRPLSYPGTAVFLLCFSVDSRTSFKNVRDKWQPELNHHCKGVPIVLVATKADLRNNPDSVEHLKKQGAEMISRVEGEALARDIAVSKYVECSALQQQGLDAVFNEAVRAYFAMKNQSKKSKKSKGCDLL